MVVRFDVDERGVIDSPRVIQASHPDFVPPVLLALRTHRFEPAWQHGRAVRSGRQETYWFDPGIHLDGWAGTRRPSTLGNHAYGFRSAEEGGERTRDGSGKAAVLTAVNVVYPFELALAGTPGNARIDFVVTPEGRPTDVQVVEASDPRFGAALRAMVEACRFEPAAGGAGAGGSRMTRAQEFSPLALYLPLNDGTRRVMGLLRSAPDKIHPFSQLDVKPKALYQPAPVFPLSRDLARLSGEAEIEFFIDTTGRVQLPRVVAATTPELGWAAATAVQQWFFDVPQKNGKPAVARTVVPIAFAPVPGAAARGK